MAPGEKTYSTIQAAINDAATGLSGSEADVVVVWPNQPTTDNPAGAYYENVVVHSSVKLQGVGPGGQYGDGTAVAGSILDGRAFGIDNAAGIAWVNLVGGLQYTGPTAVPDGAVVTVLPNNGNQFTNTAGITNAAIDGFRITGGYQHDQSGALNAISGGVITRFGAPGAQVTQGGGIYVHASAHYLAISNNLIIANGGSYAGGIRVGTPYDGSANNNNITIGYNRIRDNGGTNLAGGIGIFDGSTSYAVDHNDICGNFSSEYGGGVSQYGFSSNGRISNNRVWFNESYDEGGGIMLAGELNANPNLISAGTGSVTVSRNEIVTNTANDDGGGLRLLSTNNALIRVENNIIADNMSTHEGGGMALDDAANVQVVNNTVARNITTATAVTSDGTAAAAGLSTGRNSTQLQATLPGGSPTFSKPVLLNDLFWENKAGWWDGVLVHGVGAAGDTEPENFWDMGSSDGSGPLQPRYGSLTTPNVGQHTPAGALVTGTDVPVTSTRTTSPFFVQVTSGSTLGFLVPYSVGVDISTLRTFPGFRQSVIVASNIPPDLQGNYHIAPRTTSGAGTSD